MDNSKILVLVNFRDDQLTFGVGVLDVIEIVNKLGLKNDEFRVELAI